MTTPTIAEHAVEDPLWFGPSERPLFGWLTMPPNGLARGGVLIAPPIGGEASAGRRALRHVALSLAERGFVSLHFDYHGTGDSSGNFDDAERDRAWVDSVVEAARYLRSLGLTSISTVGMRLGATTVGVAADVHDLQFSSMVLWDPCESGRSYLREQSALQALSREDFRVDTNGSIETSEFLFTQQAAAELRKLSLSDGSPGPLAERVLVVTRDDRRISDKFRDHLENKNVEWATTTEQGPMLDIDALYAVSPLQTIDRIVKWLAEPPSSPAPFDASGLARTAVVVRALGVDPVSERCVQLGAHRLFGIVSEPIGAARGPWIVLLNSGNENHTGRARLWVELSRRWAGHGLRCVRFDLSGFGDSPWRPGQPDRPMYNQQWLDDVVQVARELSPKDPSNSVLIGLCSGAYLAVEGALSLKARGACAINPPVGIDFLHATERLETSRRTSVRAMAVRLKQLVANRRWDAAVLWETLRVLLPSAYFVDVMTTLANSGTDLLVLASTDDISPYQRVPFFRSIDIRRLLESKNFQVKFVPGLDHGMHDADGRARVASMIDRHVLEHFAGVSPRTDSETRPAEDS